MFGNFKSKKGSRGSSGKEDSSTFTHWQTPWAWRDEDATYVGWNKDVWLYREIDVNPLTWEDPSTRLSVGNQMTSILNEIGYTSKDMGGGIASLSFNRQVHIVSVMWDDVPQISDDTTYELREFIRSSVDFLVPRKAVVIGVKLRSSAASNAVKNAGGSPLQILKNLTTNALGENIPDLAPFLNDKTAMDEIFRRNGARLPKNEILNQVESWYNFGKGVAVEMLEAKDVIYVDNEMDRIEFAAVRSFNNPVQHAPNFEWLLSASTHPSGTSLVSVRGELEPSTVARSRSRRAQRKVMGQIEEERATGDLEKIEDTITYNLAQTVENFFVGNSEPLLSNCSIIMARRDDNSDETYIDFLRNNFDIDVVPLIHRQMPALDETLPCSSMRINPFLQDISIGMISYAGMQGFSNLGDKSGIFLGLNDPDYTTCWLDPLGAPKANKPPAMGIFGEPGSGKTYAAQMIATQAKLSGLQVIFVNPKGYDSLSPFAEYAGGTVVKMSTIEDQPGFFDPFGYAPPDMAAEIASSFILTVLGNNGISGMGFTSEQELALSTGLKKAAAVSVKCVGQALEFVEDIKVRKMVMDQVKASSMFSLGISMTPRQFSFNSGAGLTLIEFDRKLPLPEKSKIASSYSRDERIALATIRLVTRASLEMLAQSKGGVFILDEAWTFLGSADGLSTIEQLGREGRSLNILPIFITQRIADLVKEGVDMESYMSRVLVLKLTDENEARAALKLCRLEATQDRINWLRSAGPRRASEGMDAIPARGLHRDLNDRHAAVMLGPVPPEAHDAFTTNPEERAKLAAQKLASGNDEKI